MKIGIGVCSYNRPKECKQVCESIIKTLSQKHEYDMLCSIDGDSTGYNNPTQFKTISNENGGVAVNKNRLLKRLKDNDIVFLFEDDLLCKKPGWIDLYLHAHKLLSCDHFNYIRLDHRDELYQISRVQDITIGIYQRNTAQLMVLTKKAIDTVGGFDESFGKFGFEHCDYTRRCKTAGLCFPANHHAHPHIYEADLFLKEMDVKPCYNEEERKKFVDIATQVYVNFNPNKIHIPFKEER